MGSRHALPHLLSLSCLVALFVLASCASPTVTPTKEFVRTTSQPVAQADDLVVVVDACMTMDRLTDYISVEDSRKIESYMASALTSYFDNIGYKVSSCCMPFVGGFKSPDATCRVKQVRKDKAADIRPPFFSEEVVPEKAACQQALARVIRQVVLEVQVKDKPSTDTFKARENIREDLNLLQEHFQKRYILVAVGEGTSVPGLTSFAQGMATGMATGLLTGGLVVVTASDVSFLDTYAAIIDLSEGELLWSNSLRLQGGKVCAEKFYSTWNEKLQTYDGWAHNVFFYVPVKAGKLIEAAKNGENERLQWMLSTGADPNEGDGNQKTCLHWACQNGHLKTLQLLAKRGANVNCQDAQGETPLHYAVQAGKSNMVKALLRLKANVHTKPAGGESPLDMAASRKNKGILKMLNKAAKG